MCLRVLMKKKVTFIKNLTTLKMSQYAAGSVKTHTEKCHTVSHHFSDMKSCSVSNTPVVGAAWTMERYWEVVLAVAPSPPQHLCSASERSE